MRSFFRAVGFGLAVAPVSLWADGERSLVSVPVRAALPAPTLSVVSTLPPPAVRLNLDLEPIRAQAAQTAQTLGADGADQLFLRLSANYAALIEALHLHQGETSRNFRQPVAGEAHLEAKTASAFESATTGALARILGKTQSASTHSTVRADGVQFHPPDPNEPETITIKLPLLDRKRIEALVAGAEEVQRQEQSRFISNKPLSAFKILLERSRGDNPHRDLLSVQDFSDLMLRLRAEIIFDAIVLQSKLDLLPSETRDQAKRLLWRLRNTEIIADTITLMDELKVQSADGKLLLYYPDTRRFGIFKVDNPETGSVDLGKLYYLGVGETYLAEDDHMERSFYQAGREAFESLASDKPAPPDSRGRAPKFRQVTHPQLTSIFGVTPASFSTTTCSNLLSTLATLQRRNSVVGTWPFIIHSHRYPLGF